MIFFPKLIKIGFVSPVEMSNQAGREMPTGLMKKVFLRVNEGVLSAGSKSRQGVSVAL
ncbi:MAG: hypothetical protein LBF22_13350 [Deltaproteobacteria bacterium]|jgi:hypothetical protein|nr:hypothetical protein [Deltaproteobacteria bacterium]